ncbi:MAG: O-antigen ligase family protein [Alphaproteobacteria bacterium]
MFGGQTTASIAPAPLWGRPDHAPVYRAAEVIFFIILLYLFQIFTPEIEQIDLSITAFAVQASKANTLNQFFWLAAAALLSLLILRQPERFLRTILGYLPLLLLMGYVLLSSNWAIVPSISFRRAVLALIIIYCLIITSIYVRSPRRMFFVLYAAFAVALIQSLIAATMGTSYTSLDEFRGFQNHKNTMGAIAGYAFITGLFIHRDLPGAVLKLANVVFLAAFVFILVIAKSKTAQQEILIIPVLTIVALIASRLLRVSVGTTLMMFLTLLFLTYWILVFGFGIESDDVLGVIVADVTFTDRTIIWDYVSDKASERWLLGYGHMSFWAVGLDSVNLTAPVYFIRQLNQAHNGFLDIWLNLGIIGVLLFFPILWRFDQALRIARDSHPHTHNIAWGLMLYAIVHNLTESTILLGQNVSWVIMLIVFVAAERARYDHAQATAAPAMAHPAYGPATMPAFRT